jgi:tetratricopeptide (TPR) repeat protein
VHLVTTPDPGRDDRRIRVHHSGTTALADTHPYDRKQLIADAHRARNRGRNRQAIALYRRILIEEPRNTEVALKAAPLLAYQGASFEAWQLFRTAVAELLRSRRAEAGLGVLREACRCVPHEYEAWRRRARLELKLGREETAYQTLLEGRQHFRTPQTRAQAIALLTRARSIEPWDPEVCIDLARLYMGTDQVEVAIELLASLAERARGPELRKVRALQWRITLSFRDGWLWLRALLTAQRTRPERGASAPSESVEAPTAGVCDVT